MQIKSHFQIELIAEKLKRNNSLDEYHIIFLPEFFATKNCNTDIILLFK
jgi:hypothetical protein